MLNLLAAYIRFFGLESIENWLNSEDSFINSATLWYVAAGLGVFFLLIIIFMFFKAIKRTRERAVERRIASEVAAATKDTEKEEKKSKRVKKSSVTERPQTQPPVSVVAGGEAQPNRVLKGITLDQGIVQREFRVGEDFNCDGLVVNASYSAAPFQEVYADASAVDASTFELAVKGALSGLYVCAPDMSRPGKKTIRVCFNKQLAVYTISVVAAKATAAATAQPQAQGYAQPQGYAAAPQEQLGPRQMVSLQISAEHARRDFFVGDNFSYDGLMVTAIYNREPVREQVYNFTVVPPDMSRPGNPTVVVMCQDRASSYTISVRENPYAQPKQPVVAPQPQKERVLTRVSLNSDFAKKDYMVGEMFSGNGLSVIAHYNVEPLEEQVTNFNVLPPDMSREGMATVMVAYQDRMLNYQIMIRPNPNAVKPAAAPVVEEPKVARELLSVTLDTGAVSREFEVGEEFNCDGLILNAHYNVAPMNEVKTDFNIVDAKSFDQIIKQTKGCFVAEPDMSAAGRKVVRASLDGQVAVYTITVRAAKAAAAATVAEQPKVARELLSITLDLGVVQREFSVDDEFNCDGLLVNANYNAAPLTETRTDCNILDDRSFDKIVNHTKGCFVAEPDMSVAGRKVVRVSLDGVLAIYTISVRPAVKKQVVAEPVQPVVQPAPAPVQPAPAPVVVQEPVQPAVPRELLNVALDLSVVQREFEVGDEFNCDGLLVNANYSTAPTTETLSDCMIVDASNFDQVIKQTDGLFVAEPVMVSAGRKVVRVSLNGRLALYTILVREKKVEQPAPAPVVQPEPQPQPVYVAPAPAKPERSLLYVTLTTDRVKTNYTVGDHLNTAGLVMHAHYNAEPYMEQITSYTVSAPDMSHAGIYTVGVQYQDKMVGYQIVVNPAPVVETKPEPQPAPAPQPAPVAQPERSLLYVTLAIDKVQTNYVVGDNLNTAGLVMYAHYNAEPYMEQVTSYNVTAPDMSRPGIYTVAVQYQGKSTGYQIAVDNAPVVETKPEPQPVVVEQPQPIVVQQPQPQIIVEQPQPIIVQQPQVVQQAAPSTVVLEEESFEGRLRYDRSFNARIIQSDDKTKYWYTDVKNALLSYKKVHGRISWKRETFKCGKIVVAKLAFRGNTLVIMLPLDIAKYANSKYDLEDVSNAPSNADTPAMLRLKNDKRVKQALELIEVVMAEQGIAKDKKFEAQDYYVPYEGNFELIKKGLIKREVKSAADEAVFTGGLEDEDDGEDELVEVAPGVFVSPKK